MHQSSVVATAIFHTFLVTTESVFAAEEEMTREIKASFLMACDEVKALHQMLQFQLDQHYTGHVIVIVSPFV